MEKVFQQTITLTAIITAFTTVFLMLTPLEIIPCRTKIVEPGAEYEANQCFGYLAGKLEFYTNPGVAVDYNSILLSSIIIIPIVAVAVFFLALFVLYMKAGRESKL